MTGVVILAEAGTGKTHELRETARGLRREGKAACFRRIEELAADGLENALVDGNVEEFSKWLAGHNTAWFFLDSVDEARLANPRFFDGNKCDATNRLTLSAAEVRRLYRKRAQIEEVICVCKDQLALTGCQARSEKP